MGVKEFPTISKAKIESIGVRSLPDRPNEGAQYGSPGLSAKELKAHFDKTAEYLVDEINNKFSMLLGEDGDQYIPTRWGYSLNDFLGFFYNGYIATIFLHVYENATHEKKVELQTLLDEVVQQLAEHTEALAEDPVGKVRVLQDAVLNASATAETLNDAALPSEVSVTASLDEDGFFRFHFKLPRGAQGVIGPRGITPRLRINDATNEWEVSYDEGASWSTTGTKATGPQGAGFRIAKFYESVEQMEADHSNSDVAVGELVSIRSNVDDERNANVYTKTRSGYEFLLDMSGATGIQGPQGDDYVLTDVDKEDIAALVFDMLPSAEGTAL